MECKYVLEKLTTLNGCYILGPTGPRGIKGDTGPIPDFSIGTVKTGLPGTDAYVTITKINNNIQKKKGDNYL